MCTVLYVSMNCAACTGLTNEFSSRAMHRPINHFLTMTDHRSRLPSPETVVDSFPGSCPASRTTTARLRPSPTWQSLWPLNRGICHDFPARRRGNRPPGHPAWHLPSLPRRHWCELTHQEPVQTTNRPARTRSVPPLYAYLGKNTTTRISNAFPRPRVCPMRHQLLPLPAQASTV
jgi:hypothetical protein